VDQKTSGDVFEALKILSGPAKITDYRICLMFRKLGASSKAKTSRKTTAGSC
jgi:hypothetical protein